MTKNKTRRREDMEFILSDVGEGKARLIKMIWMPVEELWLQISREYHQLKKWYYNRKGVQYTERQYYPPFPQIRRLR